MTIYPVLQGTRDLEGIGTLGIMVCSSGDTFVGMPRRLTVQACLVCLESEGTLPTCGRDTLNGIRFFLSLTDTFGQSVP